MSVHAKMPRKVNKIFAGQQLDPGGGGLDPLNPPWPPRHPRYLGLPMVNPSKPPLPPNKPYHQPFKYPKYVKDSNLDVHVIILKLPLEQMVKQKM